MTSSGWDSIGNAELYDAFARSYPMYRETSEALVSAATAWNKDMSDVGRHVAARASHRR